MTKKSKKDYVINNDIEKKFQILKSVYEIGKILTSTLDSERVLQLITERVGELLSAKNWSLLLLDEEKEELYFGIVVGDGADKIVKKRLKLGEGIAGWVAVNRQPILIPDVSKDPRFFPGMDRISGFKTESIICAPLISKGKVLGVIELINKKIGDEFTESDLESLTHLADYIAIAIDNAKNFEKIQELTIKDDLTCLYNTRFFHEMLEREIKRAIRKKRDLSLIFMDLDHFKDVNDTYGHIYGSLLLRQVAEVIKESVRNIDIPIRYGGDEFVIVLPETGKKQAEIVARRILENLRNNVFLKEEGLNLKLTASLGYATYPEDAKDKEGLIKAADNAMYRVKNTSRNNILSA
ncbi:MAG: sensor domain-containing diguanylate cyclase [Proteobacteria bacterium]|nr:sensor domain-containing diguanylate cyclase [Pseudomonadota bacterium]